MSNNVNEYSAWDFVEKHFPDYSRSQLICDANDLQKLLDKEVNGYAETLLEEDYNGDLNNPQIEADYNTLHEEIYRLSIEEFLRKEAEKDKGLDISIIEILACEACGSSTESLIKKKGGAGIYPRYIIFNYLREKKTLPHKLEEVAVRYGLSRTTPYHALRRIDELIQSNDFLFNGYVREFNNLIAKI